MNLVSAAVFAASAAGDLPAKDPLLLQIHENVAQAIANHEKIPGFESTEFLSIKDTVRKHCDAVLDQGASLLECKDSEARPLVAIQGIMENVLADLMSKKKIKTLAGVIHTPMPPTPLCTKGTISEGLIHSDREHEATLQFTVQARATTIRNFLYLGADLYAAYPTGGFEKRTPEQQRIYSQELSDYSAHLFDRPLNCSSIESGAFYIFTDPNDKPFVFAIKMNQANVPEENGHYGIWFGELEHPSIKERIEGLLKALRSATDQPFTLPI